MTVPELVDYYTRRMDHSRERVAVMADQLVEFIEAIYDPDERILHPPGRLTSTQE